MYGQDHIQKPPHMLLKPEYQHGLAFLFCPHSSATPADWITGTTPGTTGGTPVWDGSDDGGAWEFEESSNETFEWADRADWSSLGDAITMMARVKWNDFHTGASDAANIQNIFSKGDRAAGSAGSYEWSLYMDPRTGQEQISFLCRHDVTGVHRARTAAGYITGLSTGVWYTIVTTTSRARSYCKMYLDGVDVGAAANELIAGTDVAWDSSMELIIGGENTGMGYNRDFDGRVSVAAFWNYAMPKEQAQALSANAWQMWQPYPYVPVKAPAAGGGVTHVRQFTDALAYGQAGHQAASLNGVLAA